MSLKLFIDREIIQSEINNFYSLKNIYTNYNCILLQSILHYTNLHVQMHIITELDIFRVHYICTIVYTLRWSIVLEWLVVLIWEIVHE